MHKRMHISISTRNKAFLLRNHLFRMQPLVHLIVRWTPFADICNITFVTMNASFLEHLIQLFTASPNERLSRQFFIKARCFTNYYYFCIAWSAPIDFEAHRSTLDQM